MGSGNGGRLPAQVQALIAYRNADTVEAQTLIAGDLSRTVVGTCWPMRPRVRSSGRRLPARWDRRHCE